MSTARILTNVGLSLALVVGGEGSLLLAQTAAPAATTPAATLPPAAAATAAAEVFSKEQLEQIVAPIALYPDSLADADPDGVDLSARDRRGRALGAGRTPGSRATRSTRRSRSRTGTRASSRCARSPTCSRR